MATLVDDATKLRARANKEAIDLVKRLLEEREERLIKVRRDLSQHDLEAGWERDQVMYCMGKADECREILMCLGCFDMETKVTVEMKRVMNFR